MSEKGRKKSKSGARGTTMSRKAKAKSKAAIKLRGKLRTKKAAVKRKSTAKSHGKVHAPAKTKSIGRKIVRIMGQGQFAIDVKTLKRLSDIDTAIVELVSTERSDDSEFKKKLTELNEIVVKHGKPINSREIIKSDIILPSPDLSIDEAKRLFREEGVVPEI